MASSGESGLAVTHLGQSIDQLRAETPLVAAGRAHLNNAGAAAQPQPVIDAVRRHLDLEQELGGYESAAAVSDRIEQARAHLAACVGAVGRNIAFTESATAAYVQALSSFNFEAGDVVVLSRYDYASNQIMAISLGKRRGVRLVHAEDLPEGGVDPDAVRSLIAQHRPKLVSLTHIPTSTGMIQDVAAVGAICRDSGTPFLVDACQSVGQMPVDAVAMHCDFLCATGRKFLRGPRGTGFLYVADRALEEGRHPLLIDMSGADWTASDDFAMKQDARRFELWESAVAGRIGIGAAAEYALQVGLSGGFDRAAALAKTIRERAEDVQGLRAIDPGEQQGAIVSLAVDIEADSTRLLGHLRSRGVNTSITDRASAVLDLEHRTGGTQWALRVSPHYYNTIDDIDRLFEALDELR